MHCFTVVKYDCVFLLLAYVAVNPQHKTKTLVEISFMLLWISEFYWPFTKWDEFSGETRRCLQKALDVMCSDLAISTRKIAETDATGNTCCLVQNS